MKSGWRRFSARLIAALFAACLCARASSAAAEAALSWWRQEWRQRQIIEIVTPDLSGSVNTASVTIDTDGLAREDGADLRLMDFLGVPCRFEIESAAAGVFHLQFEADPGATAYALYYGNPEAAPLPEEERSWVKRLGGLRLTTRTNKEGKSPANVGEMNKLLEDNPDVFGSREWRLIDDGLNPFAAKPEDNDRFLSVYEGKLYCPAGGTYVFATNSDDASFVVIDGRPAAQWPGSHPPSNDWDDPRDRGRTKELDLSRGIHALVYYHAQSGGGTLARLGWKPPNAPVGARFRIIGEEYFPRTLRAESVALQSPGKRINAFFTAAVEETLEFDGAAAPLSRTRFVNRTTGAAGSDSLRPLAGTTLEWDFGDGSPPSAEANPERVYRGAGAYTVRLVCRDAQGNADAVTRTVEVTRRNAQRVNVYLDALAEETVIKPNEPAQYRLRFRSNADRPLPVSLTIEAVNAAGEIYDLRVAAMEMPMGDEWRTESVRFKFPGDLGAVNMRLEYEGLEIARQRLAVVSARDFHGELKGGAESLEDEEGRRILLRVGIGGKGAERLPDLAHWAADRPLRLLVIDDYLGPPGGSEGYIEILRERLAEAHPGLRVETRRLGRAEAPSAIERLLAGARAAADFKPDVTIIAGGIADIVNYMPEARFERYLWALVERLQGASAAPTLLITPPPFVFNPELSAGYARATKRVALLAGAFSADAYSAFAQMGPEWKELYRDAGSDPVYYLSPRARGQEMIARCLFEKLTGAMP